ncbi:unnamed protein product [Acanthoscelides obtectus]|uniref:DDE Tnp4 domain-containing protein n=1 Tax=Acanthoscelides obtectus TaxID=200917 RepID=A0A9P0PFV7_ACAOB|nr:unnamed protein product [Acanthoscelides obtectus]CAK1650536.1 Protein ALP1-like [Acanthoscelides obtectus]
MPEVPKYQEEWQQIANDFDQKWNYPHCCGSIDGKHICLQAPINTGSDYFNYKGFFSIVLLAIVDANYCFTFVNIGCQGRLSDGGVFANTTFKKLLETSSLNLPSMKVLPGRILTSPFVFLGDEAFALQPHMITSFPGTQQKGSPARIYNYSRARRVVKNTFGIMSVIFRVFRKPMLLEPQKAERVVLASCYHQELLIQRTR